MTRGLISYLLAFVLTVTGFSLAQARGANPDLGLGGLAGMEMVICTGVGMKVVTLGPDGEPVESTHVCPDGAQIVAATFTLTDVTPPAARATLLEVPAYAVSTAQGIAFAASARGPPALI